jgi:hypothetical protein
MRALGTADSSAVAAIMSNDCETCSQLWDELAEKTDSLLRLIEKTSNNLDKHVRTSVDAAIHERQQARTRILRHEQECSRKASAEQGSQLSSRVSRGAAGA